MKKNIKSIVIMIITFSILLSLVIILANLSDKIKANYDKQVITDNAVLMKENKVLRKGNITGKEFGECEYGEEFIIESRIEKDSVGNPVILFNNYIDAGISIYIDNEKIYTYGMNADKNSIVCNDNMVIPIMKNCNGKTIRIVFRCTNKKIVSTVPEIYYMNSKDAYLQNLTCNLVMQILGISLIGMGIVCIALFIFNIGINVTIKQMIYISIISICGGIWILACYQVLGLFSDSYVVDFYAEYIGIYLMLFFFNVYVSDIYYEEKGRKVLKILQKVLLVYMIIVFVLQYHNVCHMNDMIAGLHLLTMPVVYYLIKYYIRKVKQEGKGYVILYVFVLIAGTFGVAYCVLHLIGSYINLLNMLPVLVFFFVVSGMANSLLEIKHAYASQAEKDALEDLIYIDKLTGINNRRGLDRFDRQLKLSGIHYEYTVYSIDLNGLKYINDNYGHSAGDTLIKSFAEQLRKVVNRNGFCGRMGGDEFIVVVRDDDYEGDFEEILLANVSIFNTTANKEYRLEYSIGAASYKIGGTATIDESIRVADYNMYEMKTRFHRKSKKDMSK